MRTGEPKLRKFLTFRCADEEFAVPVGAVREIIGWQPITSVPQTAPFVKGVINLRGRVIPVLDLESKLGLGPGCAGRDYGARACIVVMQPEQAKVAGPVGVAVEAVCDVVAIPPSDIEPASGAGHNLIETRYVEAIAKVRGTIKMLLNVEKALAGPGSEARDAEVEANVA